MTKKEKKNNSNVYFTKEVEDAIIEYIGTEDQKLRSTLYKNIIGPAFKELIENVVYAFNFLKLPDLPTIKDNLLFFLMTKINKFDKTKGSKAFSYFTVMTKHSLFNDYKKLKNKKYEEVSFEQFFSDPNSNTSHSHSDFTARKVLLENLEHISIDEKFEEQQKEKQMFFDQLKKEFLNLKEVHKEDIKTVKIIDSILELFENADKIEFFNKKGIFVYLRELSGLSSKEISAAIKLLKGSIKNFEKEWKNGGFDEEKSPG